MFKTFWWVPLTWLLSLIWLGFDIMAWYLAYGPTVALWVWVGIPIIGLLLTIFIIVYLNRRQ